MQIQWQYYVPITEGMPSNCSKDVGRVIDYIDNLAATNNTKGQQEIKDQFGLSDVKHFDDFAA